MMGEGVQLIVSSVAGAVVWEIVRGVFHQCRCENTSLDKISGDIDAVCKRIERSSSRLSASNVAPKANAGE